MRNLLLALAAGCELAALVLIVVRNDMRAYVAAPVAVGCLLLILGHVT